MHNRFLFVFISLVLVLGCSLVCAEEMTAPRVFVPESRYEFTPVLEGQSIAHDFIVENKGTADLVIKGTRTD